MAKRFTDTNKYKKPFLRSLPGPYKLLWDFLYHECDHAGIWIVDFQIAQIYVGDDMEIDYDEAIQYFNFTEERIIELDGGKKWFLPSFIEFQYGNLNSKNRAHNSVISILEKYNLYDPSLGLIRPLQGCKDKDKDKDKDKEKDKGVIKGESDGLHNSEVIEYDFPEPESIPQFNPTFESNVEQWLMEQHDYIMKHPDRQLFLPRIKHDMKIWYKLKENQEPTEETLFEIFSGVIDNMDEWVREKKFSLEYISGKWQEIFKGALVKIKGTGKKDNAIDRVKNGINGYTLESVTDMVKNLEKEAL